MHLVGRVDHRQQPPPGTHLGDSHRTLSSAFFWALPLSRNTSGGSGGVRHAVISKLAAAVSSGDGSSRSSRSSRSRIRRRNSKLEQEQEQELEQEQEQEQENEQEQEQEQEQAQKQKQKPEQEREQAKEQKQEAAGILMPGGFPPAGPGSGRQYSLCGNYRLPSVSMAPIT